MSLRVLIWDIENSPGLGYFWGQTWRTDIIKVEEPSRVMCWAAKWLGDKNVEFRSLFHDGRQVMLERIWSLLDEADAVVSYNGKRHDSPHVATEFLREGMGLPSPYRETDLYRVVKGKLKLHSNRLNSVAQEFAVGQKVAHEGLPLWLACMADDEKAWARMKKYNIQDVRLTEQVYQLLVPAIPQSMHPNHALYCDGDVCPKCGSPEIQARGFAPTSVGLYQRWYCLSCKSWSQEGRAVERATLRGAS